MSAADAPGDAASATSGRTPEQVAESLFRATYGTDPTGTWAAPGRVNLIGEHTDYNDGFVLPMAISQRCVVAAGPARGERGRVVSAQRPDDVVGFSVGELRPGSVEGWGAYVAGVLWAMREAGHEVGDHDLAIAGDVPLGASLSSSAAIECAVATAASEIGGLGLDLTALARTAQRAENDYVGVPTGAMDQMASMHGREGSLVFIDMRTLEVEHVPFDLAARGLALLVVDTRSPHALVDGEYAARRRDCEEAARLLGVPALRDIAGDALASALARLGDDRLRRRVRHVVTEDERVLAVTRILRSGADPRDIGPLLVESHVSMRDDFEITVPHVDVAVEAALAGGAHGARMTGGGFGGSVIALVDLDGASRVEEAVRSAYAQRRFGPPSIFITLPAAGAHRVD